MYAFDTRDRHKHGHRSRAWTAVVASELDVVREVARCLGEIREGRVPEEGGASPARAESLRRRPARGIEVDVTPVRPEGRLIPGLQLADDPVRDQ